jgi:glutathione S-transferase
LPLPTAEFAACGTGWGQARMASGASGVGEVRVIPDPLHAFTMAICQADGSSALSVKGMDLFDSPVICEYLDSLHKGRKLLPRKGRERWVALRLQAMADGLLDAAILTRYEGALRPKDKRWPDWIKGQTKKIEGVLAQLEAEAKSLKGKPTIGTISVACALGYLDYRFAANWRAKHPKLAKWFNSTAKTPAMKATPPPAA